MVHFYIIHLKFQSTPSVGRATLVVFAATVIPRFQSTPSVGRATANDDEIEKLNCISIHALRGEGDTRWALC